MMPSFLFLFVLILSSHLLVISCFPPRHNSDPGSLSRLLPYLPTTVRAFFFIVRKLEPFLPSSTRIKLSLPTHSARRSINSLLFCFLDYTFANKTQKSDQRKVRTSEPNQVGFEGNHWPPGRPVDARTESYSAPTKRQLRREGLFDSEV